jgi:hypothetical protein
MLNKHNSKNKENLLSCLTNTHNCLITGGLKEELLAPCWGVHRAFEEMRHKVPLAFSHMVPKERYEYCAWSLHRVPEKPVVNV